LLWAIIFGLAVAVAALWPSHYPYSQTPKVGAQYQAKDGISGNDPAGHGPTSQVNPGREQQGQHGGEHAAEVTILGVKPGEWMLSIVTLMLWGATLGLVRGADKNAERQLRAYVSTVQGRVTRFTLDEPVQILVTIKNSGQTPAYEFQHFMAVAMTDNPPKERMPPIKWDKPHVSAMGPGQIVTVGGGFPDYVLSERDKADIEAGRAAIWAYGEIRYKDAFGVSRSTHFKYCFEGKVVTEISGHMYSAADGNKAD
jgi:hypothetical protein